jgi:hypothetical protein
MTIVTNGPPLPGVFAVVSNSFCLRF